MRGTYRNIYFRVETMKFLEKEMKKRNIKGLGEITNVLLLEYAKILEKKEVKEK
jgi:hypothetical protein